ncbi:hypothetical protein CEB3_c33100 [Peptococcaceae bacterium CEB3]|nr:hypothetical protein CEB3_c33100 [Peptococcaceae bacterium CEB3]
MWPKRKVKLLALQDAVGLREFQALLKAVGLPYVVEEPGTRIHKGKSVFWDTDPDENVSNEKVSDGEVPYGEVLDGEVSDREALDGEGPYAEVPDGVCTDLIVWPGMSADIAERARIAGMRLMSPEELLAEIWRDELLLPVFSPSVGIGGKPLLWVILREAGFAPSLLWQDGNGVWQGEKSPGLGWIVPGVWLREMAGDRRLGRERPAEPVSWAVRADRVDFYAVSRVSERERYLGAVPRWPEPTEETEACGSVAQALGLGVAWADVRQALQSLWPGEQLLALKELKPSAAWRTETEGSQPDGVRRVERQSGVQLPTEEFDDLEDRRAG